MKERATQKIPFVCDIVTTCIITRKTDELRQVLIIERSENEDEGGGLWSIPGGKLEFKDLGIPQVINEDGRGKIYYTGVLKRCITREIEEETGIKENQVSRLTLIDNDCIFIRLNGKPTLVLRFKATVMPSTHVTVGGDATDYAWVSIKDLDSYTFIGNVKEEIKLFLNSLDSSRRFEYTSSRTLKTGEEMTDQPSKTLKPNEVAAIYLYATALKEECSERAIDAARSCLQLLGDIEALSGGNPVFVNEDDVVILPDYLHTETALQHFEQNGIIKRDDRSACSFRS